VLVLAELDVLARPVAELVVGGTDALLVMGLEVPFWPGPTLVVVGLTVRLTLDVTLALVFVLGVV